MPERHSRRRFILGVGTAVGAGTAGCLVRAPGSGGAVGPPAQDPPSGAGESTGSATDSAVQAMRDADFPVPDSALRRSAPKDAIAAIVDPAFARDWGSVEWTLGADERVVGVTVGDRARAYPMAVLNWHEIVNDTFGGPLLVTYCPLCGSAVVAERTVRGEATVFGVSGYLWHSDLVMYDELTGSLWSQLLAKSIQGPATGATLTLTPASLTTWSEWQQGHPETEVLLPPNKSGTLRGKVWEDYDHNPHGIYEDGTGIPDGPLDARVRVIGVTDGDRAKAYPLPEIQDAGGVVNDRVGDRPVVVALSPQGTLVAYERRIGGRLLTFETDGDHLVGGRSRWNVVTGAAVSGPWEGWTLEPATARSEMYWFAWSNFFPDTTVYGVAE